MVIPNIYGSVVIQSYSHVYGNAVICNSLILRLGLIICGKARLKNVKLLQ